MADMLKLSKAMVIGKRIDGLQIVGGKKRYSLFNLDFLFVAPRRTIGVLVAGAVNTIS
jgi:hypothetical protein